MKLTRVVPLGFSALIAVITLNGILYRFTVSSLTENTNWVIHTYQVQKSLQEVEKLLVDIQLGERGFIITRNQSFLEPYNNAQTKVQARIADVKYLISDNPAQTKRLIELEKSVQKGINNLTENVNFVKEGKIPSLQNFVESKRSLEEIRTRIDRMIKVEDELLAQRQTSANQAENISNLTAIIGTTFSILLGVLIVLFVVRRVVKPINDVTNIISASSTEIAATVEQQERITAEQASSVNQTTTSIDELGASSRQAAQQAQEVATEAQQALNLAEGGTKTVELTLGGMTALQEKVNAIGLAIERLSEQTSHIGNVSSMVKDLANQTNMLALNAAVEAVRAGENGKGFGVVASEIRKLAEQSKKSAEKINGLVADIQMAIDSTVMVTDEGTQTVKEGVQLAHETAEAFTGVTEAINQVFINSQQISLSAKQQAIAIQQVADAMNNLEKSAVQTASGIVQTKTGTHRLNEAASVLKGVV
ncbi:MAG TPA: methyl-accepting chemotaxis protein [Leptolyngbyaceae cyanobacterium]